ncbi:hypothetical protein [Roseisolibacter sp. H3M3-2]|uniref:hypothetical protein n=1 Tax=Roseisolibacter sp. H3M3-2 TaxID=3031323 RepID=UPI0023D9DFB8|nr:hypothetical protein [Roseisolibacter sp. H3M3-2]MDF1502789.1 hypothetical protein [Roseisolibacter sp. H3M3-2]
MTHPRTNDQPERRQRRQIGAEAPNPRLAAAQYVSRHRLEPFYRALGGLAIAVFGPDATVVPHLRREGRRQRLTFVVDAASPEATLDYAAFLPLEQAFWTAYAHVPKPEVPLAVAIRPARGWCRTEALAPFFTNLPTPDEAT